MSKKHPLVVRKKEEINKEGQSVVFRIGEIEIELVRMESRRSQIIKEQEALLQKHLDLSEEMVARMAQDQKEQAKEKAKQSELPLESPLGHPNCPVGPTEPKQFEVAK